MKICVVSASLMNFQYHNRDDEIVPFAHMARDAEQLPQATTRAFGDGEHQFHIDLSTVARDIMQLLTGS